MEVSSDLCEVFGMLIELHEFVLVLPAPDGMQFIMSGPQIDHFAGSAWFWGRRGRGLASSYLLVAALEMKAAE